MIAMRFLSENSSLKDIEKEALPDWTQALMKKKWVKRSIRNTFYTASTRNNLNDDVA